MRELHLGPALALLSALSLLAPSASAQQAPPTQSSAETKLHFQRAVKLYSEEDYRGALVEFKRAYELSNNYVILYNLGQTQFQLRDYASALSAFEKYLANGGSQIATARRQEVEKDLDDLRGRVARITIEVSVAGANVSVDDVVIGKSPLPGPVTVSTGARKLSATKEGLPSVTRTIEIAGGDKATVKLDFPVPASAPAPSLPKSEQPAPPDGVSPLAFVGFGVAVVGVGVGATFGILALGTKSDLDARCPDRVCPTDAQGTGDTLSTQATLSTIGIGVGILGAAVGTYFLLTGGASARAPGAASATISPYFSGSGGGLEGRF